MTTMIELDVPQELIDKELEIEAEGIENGIKAYQRNLEKTPAADTAVGSSLMTKSISKVEALIHDFKVNSPNIGRHKHIKTFLYKLSDIDIAYITCRTCLNATATTKPLQAVAIELANMLKTTLDYKILDKEEHKLLVYMDKNLGERRANKHKRARWIRDSIRRVGLSHEGWEDEDKVSIGVKCIEMFIEATGLVRKVLNYAGARKETIVLSASPQLLEWCNKQHSKLELMRPVYYPMIIKPLPWTDAYSGGYLSIQNKLVKTRDTEGLAKLNQNPMPEVYKALNAIQDTPWRINRDVFNVLKTIHESGLNLGGLPLANDEMLPPTPWSSDEEFNQIKATTPEVVREWKMAASDCYKRRTQEQSRRITLAYQVDIAKTFVDYPEIYFCWNLDWRGRMYPLQSFIHPQGDDVGRSLLEFARGVPLTHYGMKWLAVHLANSYGNDKVSFDDRIKWVEENSKLIVDSASNPLDGHRLWCDADKPYTFLAACFEWKRYKEQGLGVLSYIPVQLDGTCNGLQNFSALLRDEIGGAAVNLVPSEIPQDIYSIVAKHVSSMVEEDAANGDDVAKLWVGKIDRKLAKRNVMTMPYGAKKFGMKEQLMKELDDREKKDRKRYLSSPDNYKPAIYLGAKMYDGIGDVVIAARKAMDWLQEVARIAAKSGKSITWTTPIGFRPTQRYLKVTIKRIVTFWGAVRMRMNISKDTTKLDSIKQANGISPNFIHSLDASHLMLTVNKCLDSGIQDFCMIHDSYGTHASNVNKMAFNLREAFIAQYSEDVLENFRKEVVEQIGEELAKEIPPMPSKGKLDLEQVRYSKYFFA